MTEASEQQSATMKPDEGLLQNRVAIVTGAGRGIGLAIARAFGRAGARLVLNDLGCDRSGALPDPQCVEAAASELRSEGIEVVTDPGDVSDPEQAAQLLERAEQECGGADILVNNAGIVVDKSLFDLSVLDWDRVLATHVRGTFLCTQAFARLSRKKRTPGAIINTSSTSGMLGNVGQINESTAKAGVYGLTRTASIELQKFGIRVNAIAPLARTRLTEDLPMFEKVHDTLEAKHVAPVALYLASDLCDGLSGMLLSVAGGRISSFELVESQGRIKEADGGIWTPDEIAEHFDSICRR